MSPLRVVGVLAATGVLLAAACSSGDSSQPPAAATGGASGKGGAAGAGAEAGMAGAAGVVPSLALPEACLATARLACLPMTNEGCADGASCDYAADTREFTCFAGGNTEAEAAACDALNGPWCQPKLHCVMVPDGDGGMSQTFCSRWCCTSQDCTAPQTCVPYSAAEPKQGFGLLGICQ